MEPPNQADLDPSCWPGGSPTWGDYLTAWRTWDSVSEARLTRCEGELLVLVPEAPVSRWIQLRGLRPEGVPGIWVSVYKNLDECNIALGLGSRAPLNPELRDYMERHSKEMDEVTSLMEKDPAFQKDPKDWDQATRDKFSRWIEDVSREHPKVAPALKWLGSSMNRRPSPTALGPTGPEGEPTNQQCIASDDPRLKGN